MVIFHLGFFRAWGDQFPYALSRVCVRFLGEAVKHRSLGRIKSQSG